MMLAAVAIEQSADAASRLRVQPRKLWPLRNSIDM